MIRFIHNSIDVFHVSIQDDKIKQKTHVTRSQSQRYTYVENVEANIPFNWMQYAVYNCFGVIDLRAKSFPIEYNVNVTNVYME